MVKANKQKIINQLRKTGWDVDEDTVLSSKKPCVIFCPKCKKERRIKHPAGFLQRPPSMCTDCYQLKRKGKDLKINGKIYKKTDMVNCTCHDCSKPFTRLAKRITLPTRCKSCATIYTNKNRALSEETIRYKLKQVGVELVKVLDDGYAIIICPSCKKQHQKIWANVIASKNNIHKNTCVECSFKESNQTYTSKHEDWINEIITNQGIKTIANKRGLISDDKRLEIDVYVPSLKIGFEVNGIYWHSSVHKDKNYHKRKTDLAKNSGIRVVHLFEDEIVNKPKIVESLILSKIGKTKKIFARKCNIRSLGKKESKLFFENNHIQGNARFSESYGLIYEDRIVMAISIGKPRFNKNYDLEIIRICSELYTSVVGGTSRLINHIRKMHKKKSMISYADLRFGDGDSFKKSGMKQMSISPPNYWYVINGEREPRNKFMKHKLKSFLKNFDESKTEVENMELNKYYRIFDCGNILFTI